MENPLTISGKQIALCRYGENAHQAPAELFSGETDDPLAIDKFLVTDGTMAPSYNNWCDIDRLLQTLTHMAAAWQIHYGARLYMAVGVKHGNPCGAAWGSSVTEVVINMMAGDPLAIFGGLVMTNFEIDNSAAMILQANKFDGIVCPGVSVEAIELLARKHGKCRFVTNPALLRLGIDSLDTAPRFRYVRGGFLQQPNYSFVMNLKNLQITKYGNATPEQEADMLLAWAIGSTSNSNTITLVKDRMLIGNGVGQQDRVGAANLAIMRAHRPGHNIKGSVAYSDSFFPFPDGPQALIEAGVSAILTSSGSLRDRETISLCAERGVVLYMGPDAVIRGFSGH